MDIRLIDLTGKQFGRLTVIQYVKSPRGWLCKCSCGTEKIIASIALRLGRTKSCGCWHSECVTKKNITHGKNRTSIYTRWQQMMDRCYNPNNNNYKDYGGRGITVDEPWHVFENFYKDMGEPTTPKHSLDRIDNNKGYNKNNCRWATNKVQTNNTRRNHIIEFNGQRKTLAQWSELTGLDSSAIRRRLKLNWSIQDTLTIPSNKNHFKNSSKASILLKMDVL